MDKIGLSIICFLISICSHAANSVPPTGEFSIGTTTYFLIDSSRAETLTKQVDDYRRIVVQAFYPTVKPENCEVQLALPYADKIAYANCLDSPVLTIKNEEKYPVVILSPGFGGSFLMNMSLAEELASQGYYVLNIGHTFFNSTPAFSDGKKIELLSMDTLTMDTDNFLDSKFKLRLNTYIKIQKNDIVSVLDNLSGMLDESQQKAVDIENITCIGYSGGGATAAEICIEDKRIKAGININGVLYGDAWKDSISCPFLYINADYSSPRKSEIEIQGGQHVIDSIMQFYNYRKLLFSQKSTNDFYELTLTNTTHQNFSDYALVDQEYCGRTNPKKCLQLTYRYILLFLDKYQKSQSSSELSSDLLDKNCKFTVVK